MNKLEQAAREVVRQHSMECLSDKAVEALREALAEQALQKLSDFHQTMEQEPAGIVWDASASVVMDSAAPKNENQEVAELRKQVAALKAVVDAWNNVEQEPMYISESCAERGCACHYSVEVDGEPVAVYSAPVRTKDLTDDEIMKINVDTASIVPTCDRQFHFARAVIAADREKNK